MTTPKPPTAAGISRLLKQSGFDRSESEGRNGRCSGFLVNANRGSGGGVRVRHYFRMMGADRDGSIRKAKLTAYAETITEAGWVVEAGEYELVVTARKDG